MEPMTLDHREIAAIKLLLETQSPDTWSQMSVYDLQRWGRDNYVFAPMQFALKCLKLGIGEPPAGPAITLDTVER